MRGFRGDGQRVRVALATFAAVAATLVGAPSRETLVDPFAFDGVTGTDEQAVSFPIVDIDLQSGERRGARHAEADETVAAGVGGGVAALRAIGSIGTAACRERRREQEEGETKWAAHAIRRVARRPRVNKRDFRRTSIPPLGPREVMARPPLL